MVKTEQSRQKKLAKKRSKEIAKRKKLASEKNALKSVAGQIAAASRAPIDRCYVTGTLFESDDRLGIGSVIVTRPLSDGRVVFVCFLVDKLCLGVKDASVSVVMPSQLSESLDRMRSRMSISSCDPVAAKKLVTDSVTWAAQFGLSPRGDYERVKRIWSDVDETQCDQTFQFGRDGKPCFIQGPNDSPAFISQVMNTLSEHVGEGNYGFTRQIGGFDIDEGFLIDEEDAFEDAFDDANEIEPPNTGRLVRIDNAD
ncbi:MAG: hypothetical protein KDB00_25640 [Planctomycetales bacterium]|nr:hypothetical protein [Planctomycetales bacterium]